MTPTASELDHEDAGATHTQSTRGQLLGANAFQVAASIVHEALDQQEAERAAYEAERVKQGLKHARVVQKLFDQVLPNGASRFRFYSLVSEMPNLEDFASRMDAALIPVGTMLLCCATSSDGAGRTAPQVVSPPRRTATWAPWCGDCGKS